MSNQNFDWNNLFAHIGHRIKNENDLSDITWAFCKAYPKFQKVFLSFFFKKINIDDKSIELIREYSRTGIDKDGNSVNGRVDFYFKIDQQEYIIEVKIGDMNQHFRQYIDLFPNAERGYITNYIINLPKEDEKEYKREYQIKTWSEFYKHLKSDEYEEDKAITAYVNYLKQVCNIFELEKMNLMDITSLPSFLFVVEKELKSNSKTTYSKGAYHDGSSGKYFSLNINNQVFTGWYGIIYNISDSSWITIYIDKGTSMGFDFQKAKEYTTIGDGWNQEGLAYFTLDESLFKTEFIGEEKSLENQQKQIANFLNEVIEFIENHFENHS
jgi:hypothetical protein